MKKIVFYVAATSFVLSVKAQNYESIKNMVILQQYKKAKEELDKGMANAKFISKPEAFILKATIYAGLSTDAGTKGTATGDQLTTEADAAFAKYREMDPAMVLLKDAVYWNGPINIYSSLFSSGYKDYEAKNWLAGFKKFKKVVEYADILVSKKIINIPADTNSLLLAGITAESAGMKEEAVKYYGRIADLKAGGKGMEGIYRYLVNYYVSKKDMNNFEKYKAYGKELYPGSEFFTYDKVDFAVGLEEDLNKRIKALEEIIAADAVNYKAVILLGEIIYDTLNSRKPGAVQPSNAAELETKMVKAFNKAAALKPEDELPFIYIGDHFINKSFSANDEREAHAAGMKKRTQPGKPASKEDLAKRDALEAKYSATLETAREPYEKAAAVFAKKEKLTSKDKQQYKKAVGYLADIANYNKSKSAANSSNFLKYEAAEKKWNIVYDSLK